MGVLSAVVLAAGLGKRFRASMGVEKQAARLRGLPLLCYPITSLALAGVGEVLVAVGRHSERLVRAGLLECPYAPGVEVLEVPEPWAGNGYTMLRGVEAVVGRGECPLVSMSDHVYEPKLARAVASAGCWSIGVDEDPAYVDRVEATKAIVEGGLVKGLSKGYPPGNPVDVGVHRVSPRVLEAADLAGCSREHEGELGVSDVVNCASRLLGWPRAAFVSGLAWKDVDDAWDLADLEYGRLSTVVDYILESWRAEGVKAPR